MSKLRLPRYTQKGAALVIVLAMLVLLLGLVLAFLASSGINRQTSASSASLTAVDLLTSVATNSIVGRLQGEIRDTDASDGDPAKSVAYLAPNTASLPAEDQLTIYLPTDPAYAVPTLELGGLTVDDLIGSGMENLIKVSTSSVAIPTDEPARNGRRINAERWNKPLLMRREANDGSDDSPPAEFPIPDWILVARDGSNPTDLNDARLNRDMNNRDVVVGRYAYVVYNQGGLLDANVAGYPASAAADVDMDGNGSPEIENPSRYKISAAYADLTIPEIGLTPAQLNTWIEEWRNEATLSSDPAKNYWLLNFLNENGFLSVSGDSASAGVTDRMFVSRQQLIRFFEDTLGGRNNALMDALQYFTTFSRSLNKPTFYRMQSEDNTLPNHHANAPRLATWGGGSLTVSGFDWTEMTALPNSASDRESVVNPILPAITMTGSGTRIDGRDFEEGDPLLDRKFPLERLAWVTCKGPSATVSSTDPVIEALIDKGISEEWLQRGSAEAVEEAFGLRWEAGPGDGGLGGYWVYDVHGTEEPIDLLDYETSSLDGVVDQAREPDFFELLKATINCGAIGRARQNILASTGSLAFNDQIKREFLVDNEIIQIAANIIDQYHPENFPTHIVLPGKSPYSDRARSFFGVVDLPYFNGAVTATINVDQPTLGNGWSSTNLFGGRTPALPELGQPGEGSNNIDNMWLSQDPMVLDLTDATGANVILNIPILWNPHAQAASFPNAGTPTKFRICVTDTDYNELDTNGGGTTTRGYYVYQMTSSGDQTKIRPFDGVDFVDASGAAASNPSGDEIKARLQTQWDDSGSVQINSDLGMIEFTANNVTAIQFEFDDPNDTSLFRQPTPLVRNGVPSGLSVSVDGSNNDHLLVNCNLGTLDESKDFSDGVEELPLEGTSSSNKYFGFFMGSVPIRMNAKKQRQNTQNDSPDDFQSKPFGLAMKKPATESVTYSLEYQPEGAGSGDWVVYQQVTVPMRNVTGSEGWTESVSNAWGTADVPYTNRTVRNNLTMVDRWKNMNTDNENSNKREFDNRLNIFTTDPRTGRWAARGWGRFPYFYDPSTGDYDSSFGVVTTHRPSGDLGMPEGPSGHSLDYYEGVGNDTTSGAESKTGRHLDHAQWWSRGPVDGNNYVLESDFEPLLDPDGIVRRPIGGWVEDPTALTSTTTIGMPMSTGGGFNTGADRFNRPVILHRPFTSVGDLSHVFTDTPWRHLDFSSPESGFTGLLDVFSVGDLNERNDGVTAGKVDLNTRQMPVLKAILAGAYRDDWNDTDHDSGITGDEAEALAEALIARTSSNAAGQGPLWNVAHLVGRFDPGANTSGQSVATTSMMFDGFSSDLDEGLDSTDTTTLQRKYITRLREAPIRALAQNGQAGTWNVLVDIVAQTGRYSSTADDLNDFMAEAEKRIWLHLAIDRMTGNIIDYQVEVVTE